MATYREASGGGVTMPKRTTPGSGSNFYAVLRGETVAKKSRSGGRGRKTSRSNLSQVRTRGRAVIREEGDELFIKQGQNQLRPRWRGVPGREAGKNSLTGCGMNGARWKKCQNLARVGRSGSTLMGSAAQLLLTFPALRGGGALFT